MRAVLLWLFAACSFTHGSAGIATDGSAGLRDGAPDAACAFSTQLDTCGLSGTDDLTLTGANTYDTDSGTLMMGGTPIAVTHVQLAALEGPVDAIVVHDFHMTSASSLRATGSLPLAIVAFGAATLDGSAVIDLTAGGAGARTSCTNGAMAGENNSGGAGGGGGGGFGAAGGDGGPGNQDGTHSAGGSAGQAAATMPRGPLGGCPGSPGGKGDENGGAGGLAGGAIYIVAKQQITLASGASINAGGQGGGGGHQSGLDNGDAGGGGGGSGGMILLEAPHVMNGGVLAANGGGGGEGSGGGDSGMGGGTGLAASAQAPGGGGQSSSGVSGGDGGAKFAPAGTSVTTIDQGGGGGGGGGVGYVFVVSVDKVVGVTSPDAM